MKTCNDCGVFVDTGADFCPLCGAALQPAQTAFAGCAPPPSPYPDLRGQAARYNLIVRTFLFISLFGCGVCLLINLLVPARFWWSLIVIAAVAYCWLSIPPMLRRGANYAARTVLQVTLVSLFVLALDFIVGYTGWSVSYVIPALLSTGILAILLMVAFNRTSWTRYVMYQVLMGIFGFIPLVLYLLGFADSVAMVLVTAGLALASLLATIVFGDRGIKNEFRKRFHF